MKASKRSRKHGQFKHWLKTSQAKQLFSLCRWLHVYISTALFTLLIFFCVTGITLNHPQWAGKKPAVITELKLPEKLIEKISTSEELPLNAIQHYLEDYTGLSKPRNIDVMPDDGEITYDYPLPAGYVFITVFYEEETFEIEHKKGSFLALMNDLHKGRHSGIFWQAIIDISAVLILLFSLTGLFILLQSAKYRRHGLKILIAGSLSPVLFYYLFVPQL